MRLKALRRDCWSLVRMFGIVFLIGLGLFCSDGARFDQLGQADSSSMVEFKEFGLALHHLDHGCPTCILDGILLLTQVGHKE